MVMVQESHCYRRVPTAGLSEMEEFYFKRSPTEAEVSHWQKVYRGRSLIVTRVSLTRVTLLQDYHYDRRLTVQKSLVMETSLCDMRLTLGRKEPHCHKNLIVGKSLTMTTISKSHSQLSRRCSLTVVGERLLYESSYSRSLTLTGVSL